MGLVTYDWTRTGRYRLRQGWWSGLVLQVQERRKVLHRDTWDWSRGELIEKYDYRWRDAQVTDLPTPAAFKAGSRPATKEP
jgi:hypothetical protein